MTLKFDGWPSKTIGHLFYATSSFVQHFIAIGEFKLELQSGNAQSGSNSAILAPCDLEIWRMTLKNNRAPLLSNIELYVSFHHHMWIQTGVTVRKRLSWVVTSVTLTFDLWPWPFAWTSLLSLVITPENFMMIGWWEHSQKGVTDRRTDGRTDGRTDRRTDWTIHRAAWSQLKTGKIIVINIQQNRTRCTQYFWYVLYMDQVKGLWLSCYQVLLSFDSKTR